MLSNFVKIATRNILKNPGYSFINLFGLSIGIACSILILLWVGDELSYNRFHASYKNLYQVYLNSEISDGLVTGNSMPYPLLEEMKRKSPDIKHIARTNWGEGNLLTVGDKKLSKVGMVATGDFFKMFNFNMTDGNPQTALNEPYSIVLTSSTAKSLFGDTDPLNQFVAVDNAHELKVTGIVNDVPSQSSLRFDYVIAYGFYEATQSWVQHVKTQWESNIGQLFVELENDVPVEKVNSAVENIIKDNNPNNPKSQLFLHPMKRWRLYTNFENGKPSGGLIEYVQIFTGIAIFVLVIACINFMNLATARSESRAREVGIRKSVGSGRGELIFQFLGESIFITAFSFLVAMLIVELALPAFNSMVNKNLTVDYTNSTFWVIAICLITVTGLIAGSYPAFFLSGFKTIQVVKGRWKAGPGGSTPRKLMVTLQFGLSILLIIGMTVVYQQIQHLRNRDAGYDRNNLIQVWTNNELNSNFEIIKQELIKTGEVKSVTRSNSPITSIFASNAVTWPGMEPGTKVSFTTIATQYDYTETMGIKMIEGRDFSREFKSDTSAMVINKKAVERMGLMDPIGSKLSMWGREWTVIGVMEDVIMTYPDRPIDPLVMIFDPYWISTVTLRLNKTQDLNASLTAVESVFKKLNPTYPFEYRFADTDYEKKFSALNLISKLSVLFAVLALVITGLGLFGLAAFTAEQRTKEIGIRKVMGATVSSLVALISKDFSKLVLIAFVLFAPVALWLMNLFLERYIYRTEIAWWIIPLAGTGALVLTLIIVSTQAVKAALSNPVDSLRIE